MDWSPIVSTLVGAGLAVIGGFVAQLRAEKQAREREGRERRAALERDERQREQEREVWARSLRYEAHVLFLKTHDELYKTAQRADVSGDYGGPNQDPPDDFLVPLWNRLAMLRLVAEKATAEMAKQALLELAEYVFRKGPWVKVDYALDQYVEAVRAEFKLGPIELMGDS